MRYYCGLGMSWLDVVDELGFVLVQLLDDGV